MNSVFKAERKTQTLYVTKLKDIEEKEKVLSKLENEYSNPKDFLNINSHFAFGKSFQYQKMLEKQQKAPPPVDRRRSSMFHKLSKRGTTIREDPIYSVNAENAYFKIMNPIDTDKMYEDIKGSLSSRETNNKTLYKSLPNIIKKELKTQENILNKKERIDDEIKIISNSVSKRSKKKIKELILQSSDVYNLSKKIVHEDAKKNTKEESTFRDVDEKEVWKSTLRTDVKNLRNQNVYNQVGSSPNILWAISHPHNIEDDKKISFKPSKSISKIIHNKYREQRLLTYDKVRRITAYKDLKINGKNLLTYERLNESKIRGKKKIYNPDYLEKFNFLEQQNNNNKGNERTNLKEMINSLFEEKVITENYNTDSRLNIRSKIDSSKYML